MRVKNVNLLEKYFLNFYVLKREFKLRGTKEKEIKEVIDVNFR